MWKQFSIQGNYKWIGILLKLVDNYNTVIRIIALSKCTVTNQEILYHDIGYIVLERIAKTKFKIGDKIRISKIKGILEMRHTANRSAEIFTIDKVISCNQQYYHLKDSNGDKIKIIFYKYEMLKTKYPDVYLVEKMLRKKETMYTLSGLV